MKKNLRNVLALALGLMTTVSFAQDWNVDSRTRIDNGGDFDKMITDQRVTLGATWGGSDWGIHVSSDVNYTLGAGATAGDAGVPMSIYEAYASTNLFGMANVTVGRQALDFGSGALISSNQWNAKRTTWDGASFDLGLSDMADITIGMARTNFGGTTDANTGVFTPGELDDNANMYANIAGSFSGWDVNVLYMTQEGLTAGGGAASDDAATGIDITGGVMGANVNISMNTDFAGNEYRVLGLTYNVNDDMTVNVASTTYGDPVGDDENAAGYWDGFDMRGTNMSGNAWDNGNMGYLDANDEMLSYGINYNMGNISLGAQMNTVTNDDNPNKGEEWERKVTEIMVGYSFNDNASLSYHMATDQVGDDAEQKYSWLTLTVTP